MNDDINNLIAMLRTDLQSSVASTLDALDGLEAALNGTDGTGDMAQTVLVDAIKAQIGVAVSEVERFDNVVRGQISIAQNYAQSLTKGE